MKYIKVIFSIVFCSAFGIMLFAQNNVGDCIGAISVCEPVYMETQSPVGVGNNNNELHFDNCVQSETNSVWYVFTVQNTGDFGFVLTPNSPSDDYDWAMFNITGKSCSDIQSDPSLNVSCNAAGGGPCDGVTGADGESIYNIQRFGCGENPPVNMAFTAHNAFVPVQAGNTYALLIGNWTGSPNGYTLDFSVGTDTGIFDTTDPEITDVELPTDCGDSELDVYFSENIDCNSFTSSSVSIVGPGGPYSATIFSENCDMGGRFDNHFVISFDPPLDYSGNYTVSIDNSPSDLCGNVIESMSYDFSFEKTDRPTISALDTVVCGGEIIVFDANRPGDISYEWPDGSTEALFTVDQDDIYTLQIEGPCYTQKELYAVTFQPLPTINDWEASPEICLDSNGVVEVLSSSGGAPLSYSLDGINFQASEVFNGLTTGDYTIYIKDDLDCLNQVEAFVPAQDALVLIDLDAEKLIEFGESVDLDGNIIGESDQYYWSGDSLTLSCIDCLNPEATPLFTMVYTLHAFDVNGCEVTQDITVRVDIPYTHYAPNIFSPNNDGLNEYFNLFGGEQLTLIKQMSIYSRWGEKIFDAEDLQPNDPAAGWNGQFKDRSVNPGTFVWIAELEFIDGTRTFENGTLTVIK